MLARPTAADPEIAAATLDAHITALWASGRPERLSWKLTRPELLTAIVELPGRRADGGTDPYFIRLGAEYYDSFPPTTVFADPQGWGEAAPGTRWLPSIAGTAWFALHPQYPFPDGTQRQLVCFSFTAQYYMTDHSPMQSQVWQQGRHTVAATLNRLHEVLGQPYYQGPSGP